MTREEAIKILTHVRNGKTDLMLMDSLDMAIEALEQEPCEDCISREKLDKALYENFHEEDSPNNITNVRLGAARNFIRNFPSINSQKLDTLDKVRVEIEELSTYDGIYIDRAYVLQIIDKYKAESEDKE